MFIQKAIDYFDALRGADKERLASLLSVDVCLCDWNIYASGKDSVLREISDIFSALSHLQIKVVNLYESNLTIIAELIITAKEIGSIKVVDIITFDRDEKICSIKAYKG